MAKYLFVYRVPADFRPVLEPAVLAAWGTWFESMGEAVVDQGNPAYEFGQVGNGASSSVPGGYTIVDAADMESALAFAKECPAVHAGGGVEVAALHEM